MYIVCNWKEDENWGIYRENVIVAGYGSGPQIPAQSALLNPVRASG
jgi:hypothetical protein